MKIINTFILTIFMAAANTSSLAVSGDTYIAEPFKFQSPEIEAGLRILFINQERIEFEIEVIPGATYYFSYTESLKDPEWKTEGMTLDIEDTEIVEGYFDSLILGPLSPFRSSDDSSTGSIKYTGNTLFSFVPTEENITGVVTLSGSPPSAAFFRCYAIGFSAFQKDDALGFWSGIMWP